MCKQFVRLRIIIYIFFAITLACITISQYLVKTVLAAQTITVTINGEPVKFETPPQEINDRIIVQIRPIAEKLGCNVEWDDETQTSYINQPGIPLVKSATKGTDINVYVNNNPIIFPDQKPVNYNDYILIPSRGVVEALGYSVIWDEATHSQIISTGENKKTTQGAQSNSNQVVFTDKEKSYLRLVLDVIYEAENINGVFIQALKTNDLETLIVVSVYLSNAFEPIYHVSCPSQRLASIHNNMLQAADAAQLIPYYLNFAYQRVDPQGLVNAGKEWRSIYKYIDNVSKELDKLRFQ